MPNGDPRDRFFYPTLTLIIDNNSHYHVSFSVHKEEFEAMKTNIEGTVDQFKTSIGSQMEQVIQNVSQLQGMYF